MAFHVLNGDNDRRTLFEDRAEHAAFLRVQVAAMAQQPISLLCYCLMPNHWRLMPRPVEEGCGDSGVTTDRMSEIRIPFPIFGASAYDGRVGVCP